MEALVDDSYEAMVGLIAAGPAAEGLRGQDLDGPGAVFRLAAKQAGLIDRVCYADQFEDCARRRSSRSTASRWSTNYKKKQAETDFSGVGGLMKLHGALHRRQARGKTSMQKASPLSTRWARSSRARAAATCSATRPGLDDPDRGPPQGGRRSQGGGRRAPHRQPRRLGNGQRPDLAGNGATKKPLVASMGDVAGSGGYYIAMGARTIIAEPGTSPAPSA